MPVVRVSANGTVVGSGYHTGPALDDGFAVFELPSCDATVNWAAWLASACCCDQELRVFHIDPAS
ncbi:hypothetical protein [Luteimonas terrae]|uniref:Uncharacterized protein n=1 Tax=Luteimonas terrae TaxID=1530191 RepID=A0ABU1Y0M1_9GAMM|nr:hypothetical protein [Luteimonas terrae]MDR7194569.1 hypothetical protein [Luteimonas terrae]